MNRLIRIRIYVAITAVSVAWLWNSTSAAPQDNNAQTLQLYRLQTAYHRAATVRDPVNGDSPNTITARLRDVLSLFAADAILHLHAGSAEKAGRSFLGVVQTFRTPQPPKGATRPNSLQNGRLDGIQSRQR